MALTPLLIMVHNRNLGEATPPHFKWLKLVKTRSPLCPKSAKSVKMVKNASPGHKTGIALFSKITTVHSTTPWSNTESTDTPETRTTYRNTDKSSTTENITSSRKRATLTPAPVDITWEPRTRRYASLLTLGRFTIPRPLSNGKPHLLC